MLDEYRDLIHTLNQRYLREFDRAERLEAELRHIKNSRLWRLCCWLQSVSAKMRGHHPGMPGQPAHFASVFLSPTEQARGRVSIIIPFRDRLELLHNCLRSLQRTSYADHEVILVDNGSRLESGYPASHARQRVLRCDEPFNFSRLCNLGAAAASGDFLLFLNNDIEVLSENWLTELLRLAAVPEVGAVGATLLYPSNTLQHVGIFPQTDGTWTHRYRGCAADFPGEHGELVQPRSVPAVTAACLLIRGTLFRELGGFDVSLPVTMNDVNLCLRVRERGLLVAMSPTRLLHFESLTRGYSVA